MRERRVISPEREQEISQKLHYALPYSYQLSFLKELIDKHELTPTVCELLLKNLGSTSFSLSKLSKEELEEVPFTRSFILKFSEYERNLEMKENFFLIAIKKAMYCENDCLTIYDLILLFMRSTQLHSKPLFPTLYMEIYKLITRDSLGKAIFFTNLFQNRFAPFTNIYNAWSTSGIFNSWYLFNKLFCQEFATDMFDERDLHGDTFLEIALRDYVAFQNLIYIQDLLDSHKGRVENRLEKLASLDLCIIALERYNADCLRIIQMHIPTLVRIFNVGIYNFTGLEQVFVKYIVENVNVPEKSIEYERILKAAVILPNVRCTLAREGHGNNPRFQYYTAMELGTFTSTETLSVNLKDMYELASYSYVASWYERQSMYTNTMVYRLLYDIKFKEVVDSYRASGVDLKKINIETVVKRYSNTRFHMHEDSNPPGLIVREPNMDDSRRCLAHDNCRLGKDWKLPTRKELESMTR